MAGRQVAKAAITEARLIRLLIDGARASMLFHPTLYIMKRVRGCDGDRGLGIRWALSYAPLYQYQARSPL